VAKVDAIEPSRNVWMNFVGLSFMTSFILPDVNAGTYAWEQANAISMSLSSSQIQTVSDEISIPSSPAMYSQLQGRVELKGEKLVNFTKGGGESEKAALKKTHLTYQFRFPEVIG
jgi:hypothetical protein